MGREPLVWFTSPRRAGCPRFVMHSEFHASPIALEVENVDQRSRRYGIIAEQFRPGYADLTYELKYGTRGYRGGSRSSAREPAMRGALVQMGPHAVGAVRRDPPMPLRTASCASATPPTLLRKPPRAISPECLSRPRDRTKIL